MTDEEAGVGSFAAHCEGYGMGPKPKFPLNALVRVTGPVSNQGLVGEVTREGVKMCMVEFPGATPLWYAHWDLELVPE